MWAHQVEQQLVGLVLLEHLQEGMKEVRLLLKMHVAVLWIEVQLQDKVADRVLVQLHRAPQILELIRLVEQQRQDRLQFLHQVEVLALHQDLRL